MCIGSMTGDTFSSWSMEEKEEAIQNQKEFISQLSQLR